MIDKSTVRKAIAYYLFELGWIVVGGVIFVAFAGTFLTIMLLPWIIAYLGWGISFFSIGQPGNLKVTLVWFAWVFFVLAPAFLAFNKWMSEAGDGCDSDCEDES